MTTDDKSGASVPETRLRIWVEPMAPEQIKALEARYDAQRKPAGCSWDPDAPPGVGGYRQLRLTSRTHRCNKCGNVQELAQFNKSRDRCVTCQTLDNRAMLTSSDHPSAAGYVGVTLAHSWAPKEVDAGSFDPAGRYVRFWNDMGQRPGPGWSIDRIAHSADMRPAPYGPGLCVWAPKPAQDATRRSTRWVRLESMAEPVTLIDACRLLGRNHSTVNMRIFWGWSAERAVATPTPRGFTESTAPTEAQRRRDRKTLKARREAMRASATSTLSITAETN